MSKSENFRKSKVVSDEQMQSSTKELDPIYQEFINIYDEFFRYLQTLDFEKLNKNVDDPDENLMKVQQIRTIVHYARKLSASKYKNYLEEKTIPNRTSEPNYDNLSGVQKEMAQFEYHKKLEIEERNIKIQYFMKELIKKYSIYYDPSIRNYYLYLSSLILLQYCKSHPLEKTTVHCRIKSPLGIVHKLIQRVILESHFSTGPGKDDTLYYKDTTDAFGAKLISSRDYDPYSSIDISEQQLIAKKRKLSEELAPYGEFHQIIGAILNNEYEGEHKITYRTYFDNCIEILKMQKNITPPSGNRVHAYIDEQIRFIEKKKKFKEINSTIDDIINDFPELIADEKTNFFAFYNKYRATLPNELSLFGLRKGFNRILNQTQTTIDDLAIKKVYEMFGTITYHQKNYKYTSSGHNAIHYILSFPPPIETCEWQLQTILDYNSDRNGPTSAHATMDGKKVLLIPIPRPVYTRASDDNLNEFVNLGNSSYSKRDIVEFKEAVEIITPKKYRISFDKETIKIQQYTTFQNYGEIAKELPPDDPYLEDVEDYFEKLKDLPDEFFAIPQSKVIDNIKLSNIEAFIKQFSQIFDISIDTNSTNEAR